TGFAEEENEEDEINRQLKAIKSEDELDVPSFLRRPLFSRHRQAVTPTDKVTKSSNRMPWK
ncbi:MAG: cell division protein FtsZ, partial [Chloroflexi bacterium]|nr:cell division protein FtsZ [Chloroflexota bacterium]